MAVYSATWKDSLTKKRPSFTSPTGHDTDTRFKCAMAAVYHLGPGGVRRHGHVSLVRDLYPERRQLLHR